VQYVTWAPDDVSVGLVVGVSKKQRRHDSRESIIHYLKNKKENSVDPIILPHIIMVYRILFPLLLVWLAASSKASAAKNSLRKLSGDESDRSHFRHIMHNHSLTDAQKFKEIALSCTPLTDKVRGVDPYNNLKNNHRYQLMYGTFLLAYVRRQNMLHRKTKFLEIGLGCNMKYGMNHDLKTQFIKPPIKCITIYDRCRSGSKRTAVA